MYQSRAVPRIRAVSGLSRFAIFGTTRCRIKSLVIPGEFAFTLYLHGPPIHSIPATLMSGNGSSMSFWKNYFFRISEFSKVRFKISQESSRCFFFGSQTFSFLADNKQQKREITYQEMDTSTDIFCNNNEHGLTRFGSYQKQSLIKTASVRSWSARILQGMLFWHCLYVGFVWLADGLYSVPGMGCILFWKIKLPAPLWVVFHTLTLPVLFGQKHEPVPWQGEGMVVRGVWKHYQEIPLRLYFLDNTNVYLLRIQLSVRPCSS